MQQQLIIVLISKMPGYEYFGMWEFVTQIPPLPSRFLTVSVDLILEQMVGHEMLKMLKKSSNVEMKRRLLVGKWLYVRGYLSDEFPHSKIFIPGHLADQYDD